MSGRSCSRRQDDCVGGARDAQRREQRQGSQGRHLVGQAQHAGHPPLGQRRVCNADRAVEVIVQFGHDSLDRLVAQNQFAMSPPEAFIGGVRFHSRSLRGRGPYESLAGDEAYGPASICTSDVNDSLRDRDRYAVAARAHVELRPDVADQQALGCHAERAIGRMRHLYGDFAGRDGIPASGNIIAGNLHVVQAMTEIIGAKSTPPLLKA